MGFAPFLTITCSNMNILEFNQHHLVCSIEFHVLSFITQYILKYNIYLNKLTLLHFSIFFHEIFRINIELNVELNLLNIRSYYMPN